MVTKSESKVQTEIIKYIEVNGWYVIKVIRGNKNGIHDLLSCINGLFVSIEVKAEKFERNPEKQASAWQLRHLRLVKEAKGMAMVVATLEQFKIAVGNIIEPMDFLD